ncbi:phytochelatin synthase family protein [Microvirga pakistanensis]|uniref:phytochelatin synthase family protein n=1 Tax=Microvirga pakistanensis TaxID=1682650 RepID=UPI00106D09A8|nr:phytochelatin synthase family protein [Microvirga pakistanensis]
MRVIISSLKIIGLGLWLATGGAAAQTLPLPESLVSLNSERGARLLLESEANRAYWPLSIQFVTQKNQAYCGVASLTMVLNALGVPAPSTPEFEPFKTFTQDNLLNETTEKVLPKEVLARIGMTLDQIGGILESYSVTADVRHAADTSLDEFRKLATEALNTPNRYVIVNYLRRTIGQERGGHISPLAAYDADTDRFLVLDVSRYKYPPVWVEADDLFAAMNTPDSDNGNRTRGFVLVAWTI